MELTRRDALVALAGGTALTAGAGLSSDLVKEWVSPEQSIGEPDIHRLIAIAGVLYPSQVEISQEFVETYVLGRINRRDEYLEGVENALTMLKRESHKRYSQDLADLDESAVENLLRSLGVDKVYPVPEGTEIEQIKYYIINELLYAFYTTPVGGQLVGYENPDGYPGGTTAYQQGPET